MSSYAQLRDKDWLYEQYVTNGRTTRGIAEELGCVSQTVSYALKQAHIPIRPPGRIPTKKKSEVRNKKLTITEIYPQLIDKEWLYAQYITNKKTIKNIAKEIGCSDYTVNKFMRRFNIPLRARGRPLKKR